MFFFFNDTATTEIYTLSLHDALPIWALARPVWVALKKVPDWRWLLGRKDSPWYPGMTLFRQRIDGDWASVFAEMESQDRKSTRLNSSHLVISYAVFCLKKKNSSCNNCEGTIAKSHGPTTRSRDDWTHAVGPAPKPTSCTNIPTPTTNPRPYHSQPSYSI